MAYNKQQWRDEIPDLTKPIKDASGKQKTDPQTGRPLYELVQEGTRITSARLNHIEDGIETVNELVDQNTADIDTHKKDAVKHITAAERAEWKAKETPAGAQTKADAALSAAKTYADTALLAKADKSSTYSKTETDQRIQAVVGAAPDALDTLKEIGDALNNDPNFAATVTNQLSGKVDKVAGKQLSTEDYSSAEKAKLAGLTPGAGAAGSATDTTIGNRTADPSITTPYSLTGTITQWFSWLTKYLKSITGKANPFDAPDITLAATKTHVDDTTRHITAVERTAWNVKETPTGAQAKADAAQAAAIATAATDATTKANSAQTAATNAANTALALKAPLASPALTGTPTAPTAAVGTNSTQLATTAFVQAEKASPSIPASTDLNVFRNEGDYYCASNATAATILNMPPAIAGQSFYLHNGTHAGVNQSIVSYNSTSFRIYTRNFYSPNTPQWSDWMEIEHSGRKNVSGGYAGLDTNSKVARANTYNDLGGSSTIPTVDLDLALTAGVYPISPVTLNKPTASMWGQVLVFVSGAETHNNANTWTWQIILQSSGGSYVRYKDAAAVWSAWVPLWTGNNDAPLFMTRSQIANNTDFNTVTANGIYIIYQPTGTTNAPPVTYGVFSVSKAGVNYVEQRITEVTTGDVYSRVGNVGSSWTPWVVNITSAGGKFTGPVSRVYGAESVKLSNVASYKGGQNNTGAIKITLPVGWNATMMTIKITGYEYASNRGAWELVIGGYNFSSGWTMTSALADSASGSIPFTSVRLAYDGTKCCILLGTTTSVTQYPHVEVTEVLTSHNGAAGLVSAGNWTITNITNETGIANIVYVPIKWGNSDTLGGFAPALATAANTVPVRGSDKKIIEVPLARGYTYDNLVTTTSNVSMLNYMPIGAGMYEAKGYLRLTSPATVEVNVTFYDGKAQTSVMLPSQLLEAKSYHLPTLFLAATSASTISIEVKSSVANVVYISAVIEEA